MAKNTVVKKIDWLSIVFYMLLVGIGWLNIYSASVPVEEIGAFNINNLYGKQLIFIGLSILLILFILASACWIIFITQPTAIMGQIKIPR